jgi:hypothetical protein
VALSGTRIASFAGVLALLFSPATPVLALTLDFEDRAHGDVVSNQYQEDGVDIVVDNVNRDHDIGVAFDTGTSGNVDVDLEGPFSVGNLGGIDLGRILVINQNDEGCDDGVCDVPDDEGRRPAGTITLDFDFLLSSFGLDLIDIDSTAAERGSIAFFLGDSSTPLLAVDFESLFCPAGGGPFCDPSLVAGNRSANRVQPFTEQAVGSAFDRVVIAMGGSGGVDNLVATPVPEPATLALAAPALALLALAARRRRA